jgi:hypothetical protein
MRWDDGGAGVSRSAGDRQLDAAARAAMSQHRGGWSVIASRGVLLGSVVIYLSCKSHLVRLHGLPRWGNPLPLVGAARARTTFLHRVIRAVSA